MNDDYLIWSWTYLTRDLIQRGMCCDILIDEIKNSEIECRYGINSDLGRTGTYNEVHND
jgi:hypothetical protein